MFFKRIGAKKCKFTVNLYLKQLTATPEQHNYIKVLLVRGKCCGYGGDHHCESDKPEKVRKGVCNFNREKLSFECTMFFDSDTNAYLEKKVIVKVMQAQLKIKECEKDGSDAKTLAKLEFDLAEYLNMEEPMLAIEFEFEKSDAKLQADLEFVRNDEAATELDDKKSIRSEETVKSSKTEGNGRKKSNDKPAAAEIKNLKKQLSKIEEAEEHISEIKKNKDDNRNLKHDKKMKEQQVPVVVEEVAPPKKTQPKEVNEKKPAMVEEASKPLSDDRKDRNSGQTVKYSDRFNQPGKKESSKDSKLKKRKQAEQLADFVVPNTITSEKNGKTEKETKPADKLKPPNSQPSPFLLRKEIEEKGHQIQRLRNENSNLMEVIDRLSKQSLPTFAKTQSISRMEKLEAQNKSLKDKLVEKQIALGDFEVRLRSSKEREERFEQSLKRTTKDYESVREQLETSKNKIAELLQSCFELGDSDLISFVQRHLELE